MTSAAAVEVAASIAMRIVAVEAMVVVATEDTVAVTTTTTVDHQDTKTETTVPMDDVMTMGPAASIAMLRVAVMIATAAAEMTVVVAAAVAVTIEAMVVTVTQLLGSLVTHMEVEPPMIALTIGTPVVKLRSAKIHRYGALCKINAPRPTQPYGLALDQNCW